MSHIHMEKRKLKQNATCCILFPCNSRIPVKLQHAQATGIIQLHFILQHAVAKRKKLP